jgi:hypothetical protein
LTKVFDKLVNISIELSFKFCPVCVTVKEVLTGLVNNELITSSLNSKQDSIIAISAVGFKIFANKTISNFHVITRKSSVKLIGVSI